MSEGEREREKENARHCTAADQWSVIAAVDRSITREMVVMLILSRKHSILNVQLTTLAIVLVIDWLIPLFQNTEKLHGFVLYGFHQLAKSFLVAQFLQMKN